MFEWKKYNYIMKMFTSMKQPEGHLNNMTNLKGFKKNKSNSNNFVPLLIIYSCTLQLTDHSGSTNTQSIYSRRNVGKIQLILRHFILLIFA